MAYIIDLKRYPDKRGVLTVIDKALPFDVKRIYYISGVEPGENRGGHRHYETIEGVICMSGSFTAGVKNASGKQEFLLDDLSKCLIVEPGDWHEFYDFAPGSVLMGISSTHYDKADYNDTPIAYDSVRRPEAVK